MFCGKAPLHILRLLSISDPLGSPDDGLHPKLRKLYSQRHTHLNAGDSVRRRLLGGGRSLIIAPWRKHPGSSASGGPRIWLAGITMPRKYSASMFRWTVF